MSYDFLHTYQRWYIGMLKGKVVGNNLRQPQYYDLVHYSLLRDRRRELEKKFGCGYETERKKGMKMARRICVVMRQKGKRARKRHEECFSAAIFQFDRTRCQVSFRDRHGFSAPLAMADTPGFAQILSGNKFPTQGFFSTEFAPRSHIRRPHKLYIIFLLLHDLLCALPKRIHSSFFVPCLGG